MKKRKSIGVLVVFCLLLLGLFCCVNVFAAVTEGKAGETLTGEYAVIVNTDSESVHNTGTLVFDDQADGVMSSSSGENLSVSGGLDENGEATEAVNVSERSSQSVATQTASTAYTNIWAPHIPKRLMSALGWGSIVTSGWKKI